MTHTCACRGPRQPVGRTGAPDVKELPCLFPAWSSSAPVSPGIETARHLSRRARGAVEVVLVNPTDYFLYLPLLPEVAGGVLDPRRVTVPLARTLPGVRLVLGKARRRGCRRARRPLDRAGGSRRRPELRPSRPRRGERQQAAADPGRGGERARLPQHRRGPPPARSHHPSARARRGGHRSRRARRPLHVRRRRRRLHRHRGRRAGAVAHPRRRGAPDGTPGHPAALDAPRHGGPRAARLDEHLSRTTDRVLRERGIEVRVGTSVKEATADGVRLTDGSFVPSRTLVWCVGVRPDPLAQSTGLPTEKERLVVDEYLACAATPRSSPAATRPPCRPDPPVSRPR